MRLTHSSMSTFRTCNRRYKLAYHEGIRPARESDPLRTGGNVHIGLDARAQGASVDDAVAAGIAAYAVLPSWVTTPEHLEEWAVERATVSSLLAGYFWRWGDDGYQIIATEQEFELPILNPATGKSSRRYTFAGKMDKIVKLPDGRVALMEHKTTSESIEADSDYWKRLRLDQQISGYYHAARRLGYDVQTVIYDVIRKPSIRPKLVNKVRETAEQYGERLLADIGERPDFYYARREIPRLQNDLDQFAAELWAMTQIVGHSERYKMWPRNTAACVHPYRCQYLDVCDHDTTNSVPDGFVRVDDPHVELTVKKEKRNDNNGTTTQATVAPAGTANALGTEAVGV